MLAIDVQARPVYGFIEVSVSVAPSNSSGADHQGVDGTVGTSDSTPVVQRAPEVVELVGTTLKTRLLIEHGVTAAQSRPAESGTQ